jgi:hypothetical protein
MSLGFRAESTNTSGVITVAGVDQVVINNAGNVAATTFTGALVGNAATATGLSTSTGAAPSYGVRAWVSFSGTNNTSNVIDSSNTNRYIFGQGSGYNGNISTVARISTGLTFATAMPTTDYCVTIGASGNGSGSGWLNFPHVFTASGGGIVSPTTTNFRIAVVNYNTTGYIDPSYVNVMVMI